MTNEITPMAALVYCLGTLVTLLCALLLLRSYARTRTRLLLWSGLCFSGLTLSNLLLTVDMLLLTELDLYLWRLATAALAMLVLLYGLVFASD
jgi:hypothetical protein